MRKMKGFLMLLRIIPVFSWSFSAIILGLSIVVNTHGWGSINWWHLALIFLTALLAQGVIAHAYNDIEDWQSGTDQKSPGLLSGGSGVIPGMYLTRQELTSIARQSIIIVMVIALYFYLAIGPEVIIFLMVGLWAGVAYSCAPLKFAYRPLLGEWICAWPAMVTCTVGTSFVLSGGEWYLSAFLLGALHGTFSIIWLMMHHVPDMEADLMAQPKKWTTVAYLKEKQGWRGVTLILRLYLFTAFILAILIGYMLNEMQILVFSSILLGLILYWIRETRWMDVEAVTRTELRTIALTIINVIGISWFLLW